MKRGRILTLALILVGLGCVVPSAGAATTTLTFDEFANATVLTTQYQNLGVTISGATVYTTSPTNFYPSVSGDNVAYAPSGQMTFTFSVGGVQAVSAYVTDYSNTVTIYAYDSANNLVGQSSSNNPNMANILVTFTSSGNPIAYVTITGGAGQYTVDNFSFTTPGPTYSCVGFQSPFDVVLSLSRKTNRAIPLQAQLFDSNNNPVTPATLGTAAPPVVTVSFQSGTSPAVDDTSLLDPLGQSSSGNTFNYDPTTGMWWFNLATTPFTASGTYTVTVQSGDSSYQVAPHCSGQFVRQ